VDACLSAIATEVPKLRGADYFTDEELKNAVTFIRDHWQRRYGLVQVG